MQSPKGFTLIELVITVVVLAILALVAAPQFINFSSDAERSRIQALAGTFKSSIAMVHAQANVKNLHEKAVTCLDGKMDVATETCPEGGVLLHFGYPAASENALKQVISLDDWVTSSVTAGLSGVIRVAAKEQDITGCYVHYQQATSSHPARIEVYTDDC